MKLRQTVVGHTPISYVSNAADKDLRYYSVKEWKRSNPNETNTKIRSLKFYFLSKKERQRNNLGSILSECQLKYKNNLLENAKMFFTLGKEFKLFSV